LWRRCEVVRTADRDSPEAELVKTFFLKLTRSVN
jgi:hypothetical protein